MTRTTARQIAIQLGFAVSATGEEPEEAIAVFFAPEHYASLAGEDELYTSSPDDRSLDFIRASVQGVYDHRAELDRLIAQYAKGWRPERISRSAAAILRQALYEILYMPDVPDAAAIDEAVELAKGYEEEETVAFINGVLGGFYRGEVRSDG
jgi:N utilization substance protein B